MLETTQNLIRRVGKKIGLDDKAIAELIKINAEHVFDIKLKNGKSFKAFRVQHNNKRGPYKGGIRFHPEVTLEEVTSFAMLMSFKTAAVGLPLGGAKGGVIVDPRDLTQEELEELSRQYVANLVQNIGPDKDIPAPDVNTNEKIMDWMVDEYSKLTGTSGEASFTGKSIAAGGSEGREAATGYGGVIALREFLKHEGRTQEKITFAIQGFGNVGSFFASIAEKQHPNWQLVAASDTSATVYCPDGLSAKALEYAKENGSRFKDFKHPATEILSSEEIIGLNADVLVLAALSDAVNQSNVRDVKAKYIVELANGPINEPAYDYLIDHNKIILPDIIANAGGVVVSYLEWVQNRENLRFTEDEIASKLEKQMTTAMKLVFDTAKKHKVTLKEAAYINAIHLLKN